MVITDTNNGNTHVHEVPVNETSLEAGSLERYTNYSVQVAAFTIKGAGNFTEPVTVITDEDGEFAKTLFHALSHREIKNQT